MKNYFGSFHNIFVPFLVLICYNTYVIYYTINGEVRKVKNKNKTEKKPFIKTKVKPNNAIEVEIQKNPANTVLGKILIYVIVFGMALLGLVALVILIIQNANNF